MPKSVDKIKDKLYKKYIKKQIKKQHEKNDVQNILFQYPSYQAVVVEFITKDKDKFLEKLGDVAEIKHTWRGEGIYSYVTLIAKMKFIG